jgi:hypothetical protein
MPGSEEDAAALIDTDLAIQQEQSEEQARSAVPRVQGRPGLAYRFGYVLGFRRVLIGIRSIPTLGCP